jgi:hypothetical protein
MLVSHIEAHTRLQMQKENQIWINDDGNKYIYLL